VLWARIVCGRVVRARLKFGATMLLAWGKVLRGYRGGVGFCWGGRRGFREGGADGWERGRGGGGRGQERVAFLCLVVIVNNIITRL
jgi:hypothetical protein